MRSTIVMGVLLGWSAGVQLKPDVTRSVGPKRVGAPKTRFGNLGDRVPLQPSHTSGREGLPADLKRRVPAIATRYAAEYQVPEWRERYWADPR